MEHSLNFRDRSPSPRPEPIRRRVGARLLLVTSKHVKHQRLSLDVVNKGLSNVNRDLQTQQH